MDPPLFPIRSLIEFMQQMLGVVDQVVTGLSRASLSKQRQTSRGALLISFFYHRPPLRMATLSASQRLLQQSTLISQGAEAASSF